MTAGFHGFNDAQLTAEPRVEVLLALLTFEQTGDQELQAFAGIGVAFGRTVERAHCFNAVVDGTDP